MNIRIKGITAALIFSAALITGCSSENRASITEESSQLSVITTEPPVTEVEIPEETEAAPDAPEEEITATTKTTTEATTSEEATTEIWADYDDDTYVEYHFRNSKLLNQHFEKHGGEFTADFGYDTAEDYEQGASDVINNPDALYKTEAEDGDGVYYIEATNEFVILSTDGYIRTYFRPNAGIDYFNRQ